MRVAQLGLGAMGLPIARRLAAVTDLELVAFDVDPERIAALGNGVLAAGSVADAVRGADAILTVLPADPHVEAVAAEVVDAAEPGQIFVDLSTIAPSTIDAVAARLAPAGVRTLSVAITRGTAAAERGELGLFVGGDEILVERLRPVLDAISSEVRTSGDLGSAKALKIANNMVVAVIDIGICEAIVLARKLGIDAETVARQLRDSGADGWALRNHIIACVLTDDLGPGHFSTANMAKDIGLFLEMAGERATPAMLAAAAASCYRGTIAHGHALDYHPVVIRWLEQISAADAPVSPLEVDEGEALRAISGAVVALQTLANVEALHALRAIGISTLDAAEHLASGSAQNETLAAVGRSMTVNTRALLAELERFLALAQLASVPGVMFEAARQAALVPR